MYVLGTAGKWKVQAGKLRVLVNVIGPSMIALALLGRNAQAAGMVLQVTPMLSQVQAILSQIGPSLSAVLFIVAGVFYALGQILPPEKKAQFHTTAVNVIIGALVIGALSVASTSLASASTHILSNMTANSIG